MAGDWIKLEHATVDKPEVSRVAELLGVTPEHALGLAVRFWVWFDQNSRNGVVTPCHAKSIEAMMHCPGFVAAMSDVNWLELDESSHSLAIPHADRHNGTTAKSRALGRDRQQKHRNAFVTPLSRSRNGSVTQTASPEKRRDKDKDIRARRSPELPLPDGFCLSERVRRWAAEKGHDRLEQRFEQFIGYAKRSGKRYADWDEALMSAIRENWAKLESLPVPGRKKVAL